MSEDIVWTNCKSDKPSKRSAPLSSFLKSNTVQNQNIKDVSKNNGSVKSYNNIEESRPDSKITIKDLCNEDKQRIANLIKEIAKISEEKQKLESTLEEERKQKENEIKDILKQQQKLLDEKENLINKLDKIQQKLAILKAQKKSNTQPVLASNEQKKSDDNSRQNNNNIINKEDDSLKPLPTIEQLNKVSDSFNPFKSSTPNNLSPRSLSPISLVKRNNENDMTAKKTDPNKDSSSNLALIESRHEQDLKKIELMKQQADLIEEQKKVKEMLQRQEDLLKEKQDQIALQQKIHRERLEELNRIKLENQAFNQFSIQQNNQVEAMGYQMIAKPPQILTNHNIIPQMIPVQINHQNSFNHIQEQLNQKTLNNLENLNLENLASLVYKKLKIKKKAEISKLNYSNNNNTNNGDDTKCSISNNDTSGTSNIVKQDYDEYLIDFIIEQNESYRSFKANNKSKCSNKSTSNISNIKSNKRPIIKGDTDSESDKLIEELFFLK